jgi:hypothetical protein
MKLKLQFLPILLILSLAVASPLQAKGVQQWTQTLLPAGESGAVEGDPNAKGLLWIQTEPQKAIFLQFDLSGLPPGLGKDNFKKCSLRLVAQNVVYEPADNPNTGGRFVIVNGRLVNDNFTDQAGTESIISLSTLSRTNNVGLKATEAIRTAVYNEYSGDKKISLRLFSDSHKASTLFYSSANSGTPANPSNLPRLVIEYTPQPPKLRDALSWPQLQQNPEHTGRNYWIPFQDPADFSLTKINMPQFSGGAGTVANYPLIYRGNIYLVYKVLDRNFLLALDFKGIEIWRKDIGAGTVQRPPVISRNGFFYAVTEKKITGYDLNAAGQTVAVYPASGDISGKLAAYTDLTAGNDGSLFLALQEDAVNYIYGFTPQLTPFVRSDPLGTSQEKISTVSVSPDGGAVFAQTSAGAVVIDMINPSQQRTIQLQHDTAKAWDYYQVPVAGPAGGIMIFADFTGSANSGNVWGYTTARRIWNFAGTLVAQPVLGSNDLVYFIQGGGLQAHKYDQIGSVRAAPDAGLKTTSNLVMDGANNIYFWDNGYLHGYSPEAEPLFEKVDLTKEGLEGQRPTVPEKASDTEKAARNKESSGPEQFIRLMMGPDGTLWANNKNGDALYAFKPSYASADLTLQQEDIKPQTVYRATGMLTVGGVTVDGGTQILFQAQNGIGFAKGFKVQKGASILARTGF